MNDDIKHIISVLTSHGVRLIAGVFLPPFVIGHMGKSGYGLSIMVANVMMYIALIRLGVPQASIRFLAERLSFGDHVGATQIYSSAIVLMMGLATLASFVVLFFLFQPRLLGNASLNTTIEDLRAVIMILGAVTVISMPLMIGESSLIARRKIGSYANIQTSTALLRVIIVVLILGEVSNPLLIYVAITGITTTLTYALSLYWQTKLQPLLKFTIAAVNFNTIRTILSHGGAVTANTATWMLLSSISFTIIGYYLGAEQLTYYSIALIWSGLLQGISTSVSQILLSSAAEKSIKNEKLALLGLVVRSSKFLFVFIMPVIAFLMVFRYELIATWLGGDFEVVPKIMLPILLGELFIIINIPLASIINITEVTKKVIRGNVILALINPAILLVGVVVYKWGLYEIAFIYGVIFTVRSGIFYPLIFSKYIEISVYEFYKKLHFRLIIVFVLTIAFSLLMKSYAPYDSWFYLIISASLIMIFGVTVGYYVALDHYERGVIKELVLVNLSTTLKSK